MTNDIFLKGFWPPETKVMVNKDKGVVKTLTNMHASFIIGFKVSAHGAKVPGKILNGL